MNEAKEIVVFHGSNVIVEKPKILVNGFYKDFGYGFYCTSLEKQAKRWALSRKGASIVNKYKYLPENFLNICSFSEMSDEWLDFVVKCRKGIEHNFDIVEGPMADDQVWDYVEDYVSGNISRVAFWELVKFKYPTHQIAFCTEQSLNSLIFIGSQSL